MKTEFFHNFDDTPEMCSEQSAGKKDWCVDLKFAFHEHSELYCNRNLTFRV
jgi:hypothetical protein